MAEQIIEKQDLLPSGSPKSGHGMMRVIQVVAFVSVIVFVEVVVGSMLLPSAEETTRLAQELAAASTGRNKHHDTLATEKSLPRSKEKVREVELGMFNITRYNPVTNTTLAIDFELYGTVLANDAGRFQTQFDQNKARIREQVVMTLHGVDSSDLTDAGLGLIKRRILEKTNRALREPMLKEVLFSKFNFVER